MKKQQLYTRLGPDVVERIIRRFNDRAIDMEMAMRSLGVSRAQVYNLRTQWLAAGKNATFLGVSGGDHAADWPREAVEHLQTLIQASKDDGPNYELYADELARKFGFVRDRSSVRKYCEKNLMPLMKSVFPMERKKPDDKYRRWASAAYGELCQHDSTPRHIKTRRCEVSNASARKLQYAVRAYSRGCRRLEFSRHLIAGAKRLAFDSIPEFETLAKNS